MHSVIAYHPLPNAQPNSKQQSQRPVNSPSLYTEHDVIRYGISLWPVLVSCPGYASSQLLVHLLSWESMGS